jgi:hypothetical protein
VALSRGSQIRHFIAALVLVCVGCRGGCADPGQDALCQPLCGTTCGGDDGCGGVCACGAGESCASGACVAADNAINSGCPTGTAWVDGQCRPSLCRDFDTCGAEQCGQVCGVDCGECPRGWTCTKGQCELSCDDFVCLYYDCGTVCGQDCGGCGEGQECQHSRCVFADGCPECALQLRKVSELTTANGLEEVTVEILHNPKDRPRPRLIDIRLRASHALDLQEATLGAAASAAGKELYEDPDSARPWQSKGQGFYQFLIMSYEPTDEVGAGALLRVRFKVGQPTVGRPLFMNLVKRRDTFAPSQPDLFLQVDDYDIPLWVGP